MKLVTAEQMRAVDREAIDGCGIPGPELMENAGRGIAEAILDTILNPPTGARVAIFCGKGNNGGDGFVIGRYLEAAGAEVTIYHLGPVEKLSPDARLNHRRAAQRGFELIEVSSLDDLPDQLDSDLIVDAIFGTGFAGAPRGLSGDLIEYINAQPSEVAAVDMPSGLNADTGRFEGAVVQADDTFTLALPKYGLYVSPGRELAGAVDVIPIGIPDEVIDGFGFKVGLIDRPAMAALLPYRSPEGHKGTFGKLMLLAGSTGLTGAAALAAKSALRCGCGLAKVCAPRSVLPVIASQVLEATGYALPEVSKKGALALRGLGEARQIAAEHEAVAIGPGIGLHRDTKELVQRFVSKLDRPMVIDADGLTALVGHLDLLRGKPQPAVLTPHPGEFRRFTDEAVEGDIHARIDQARAFAQEHEVVLVLKGSPTVVAEPGGEVWVNSAGNAGMATGGSGDVLTGAIGSLLAQGLAPLEAALLATYVHSLAGDLAAAVFGERALVAGDMIAQLRDAWAVLED